MIRLRCQWIVTRDICGSLIVMAIDSVASDVTSISLSLSGEHRFATRAGKTIRIFVSCYSYGIGWLKTSSKLAARIDAAYMSTNNIQSKLTIRYKLIDAF